MKRIMTITLIGVLMLDLVACGDSNTHSISKDDFTDTGASVEEWPWTSDDTTIHCLDHYAITMDIDGTTYPLNGTAKNQGYSTNDITEVWLDDPNVDGLRISADEYTRLARSECKFP